MKNPYEVVESTYELAHKKCNYTTVRALMLSIMAGAYLSMGGTLSILVSAGYGSVSANPILAKVMMGITFPIGLILIMMVGAELFTGNTATLIPAVMRGKESPLSMVRNWALIWTGNFIGSLFFGYFFVHLTGLFAKEPWSSAIEALAISKTSYPFFITMIKGVGANWLVCLAVWMYYVCKSSVGKIVGIWMPVCTFLIMGFEHSIANMFFIPMAMLGGADISVAQLFVNNLIPATIGNILGGALFVGCFYGALFGEKK